MPACRLCWTFCLQTVMLVSVLSNQARAERRRASETALLRNPGWSWRRPAAGRWLLAKQRQPRNSATQPAEVRQRPALRDVSQFMLLEREVEFQYRPRILEALQNKVHAVADSLQGQTPACSQCGQPMKPHDTETVSWRARLGCLHASVARYRCPACQGERRPLLDLLGVEPGRISGSLARLLALLAVVAPYPLAAALAWLWLGVKISRMGIGKVVQRLGESACRYSEGWSPYHADSRSEGASIQDAPPVVLLSVDGSILGMQGHKHRRRPWVPSHFLLGPRWRKANSRRSKPAW